MTIISSNIENANGNAFEFEMNDQRLIVQSGVILASDTDSGVFQKGFTRSVINNYGVIYGQYFGIDIDTGNNFLLNGDTGSISGAYGIHFYGSDNTLINEGKIDGSGNTGISIFGDRTIIRNSGRIEGTSLGVEGDGDALAVTNFGSISGGSDGIFLQGGSETIHNLGTVSGERFGIDLGLDPRTSSTVVNSGLISGISDAFYSYGRGAVIFKNTGTLDGDVQLGVGPNTLINSGTIDGTVHLGDGGNQFDGRKGSVAGDILGGSKVDIIRAGDAGATLGGGAGHDRLYGGSGADTFMFSSYSSASSDVVIGFNAANDTIQLDHRAFTHLVADETPTFAIGTTPSTTADFLFYNPANGALYYDTDGSGTAHPSNMVAAMGKGLQLTAHNFEVV